MFCLANQRAQRPITIGSSLASRRYAPGRRQPQPDALRTGEVDGRVSIDGTTVGPVLLVVPVVVRQAMRRKTLTSSTISPFIGYRLTDWNSCNAGSIVPMKVSRM